MTPQPTTCPKCQSSQGCQCEEIARMMRLDLIRFAQKFTEDLKSRRKEFRRSLAYMAHDTEGDEE